MIFESHAHYDDEAFNVDRKEILESMSEKGVTTIINVGASLAGCRQTLELADAWPFVYAAIGVHPDEVGALTEESYEWLKESCDHGKVVAVGEIGLDYYWDNESHELQKQWFRRQLQLSRETGLPFIIHSRDAAKDTLDVMKEEKTEELKGVVHCFSYGKEIAREYLNMGHYIGVGGVITFKNARKLKEVVDYAPLDRILLETDCPYLAPVPYRGKRNDSSYLTYVAEEIASIKGVSYEQVIEQTRANGEALFFPESKPGV